MKTARLVATVTTSALAVAVLGLLGWVALEHQARTRALADAQQRAEEAERIADANRNARAALPNADTLEQWRRDARELPRLRAELDALNAGADARLARPAQIEAPPESGNHWSADEWSNRGHSTVQDALVTAAWAASRGEVDVLARSLHLQPAGREAAEAWLAQAPPPAHVQAPTPEHLVALLAAQRMQPQAVTFLNGEPERDARAHSAQVRITRAPQPDRVMNLITVRDDQGWKLLVPDPVVRQYLDALKSGN